MSAIHEMLQQNPVFHTSLGDIALAGTLQKSLFANLLCITTYFWENYVWSKIAKQNIVKGGTNDYLQTGYNCRLVFNSTRLTKQFNDLMVKNDELTRIYIEE